MTENHWNILLKSTKMQTMEKIPVGLIVDSPWIPGYCGISTNDYFTIPEKWFEANLKVKKDFPEMITFPDFNVEYGMANEPSGYGCKISFYDNMTPSVNHLISSIEDIERVIKLPVPNPKNDGLMPFVLNLYKNIEPKVKGIGELIKIVVARGPLTVASHVVSVTEFLLGIKLDPDNTHKLLKNMTILIKNWLEAQIEVLSEVESILIYDDIVGFLSKEDYLEFAHPYLRDIFDYFKGFLKIFHNDTDNINCFEFLEDLGVNIFNFTHKQEISKVRELVGDKVCLLGNIPPMDILVNGTTEQVVKATKKCLNKFPAKKGLIVSAGGGTSPGTPGQNIRAMIDTVMNQ